VAPRESSSGRFERRFWLPDDAKVDQVKAGLENGVLTAPEAHVFKADLPGVKGEELGLLP
jgi:HSP20 family protein